MFTLLKKVMLAGVGAAVISKEKAEAALEDLVREGRISAADAKVVARELADKGRREFATVRREVEERLRQLSARTDAETKARIAALESRIAELERQRKRSAGAKRARARARGA
jgi:polyhydroxyalkanoate synthesis regulator phasin